MPLRVLLAAVLLAVLVPVQTSAGGGTRDTTTRMISQASGGGAPNGASTNAVISQDLRYARIIAFESEASNLVAGDTNRVKDVFAIRRAGSYGNRGTPWRPGKTQLVSRGRNGQPANGPSFDPAVDGNFERRARCVAFLSDASNLSRGDGDGVTDAFLAKAPGFRPKRISPGNKGGDTTAVAVSGDCSRTAFITGGKLYVRRGARTRRVRTRGTPGNPAFSVGRESDLVFDAKGGVYLSRGGTRRPRRVARGGRNPAFNDVRRPVIAYEKRRGGNVQIAFRRLGGRERIATRYRGQAGNGDSRDPVIVNSGYFIGFETDASNLPIKATGERGDRNAQPDAYIYTDTRKVTILESVDSGLNPFRTGARRPDTSYYRNYVVFDSSANSASAPPQVYLRYVGGI
jgi:hypothetical protein